MDRWSAAHPITPPNESVSSNLLAIMTASPRTSRAACSLRESVEHGPTKACAQESATRRPAAAHRLGPPHSAAGRDPEGADRVPARDGVNLTATPVPADGCGHARPGSPSPPRASPGSSRERTRAGPHHCRRSTRGGQPLVLSLVWLNTGSDDRVLADRGRGRRAALALLSGCGHGAEAAVDEDSDDAGELACLRTDDASWTDRRTPEL